MPTPYDPGAGRSISIALHVFAKLVRQHFDLRPKALIEYLDLRKPVFKQTACYGHFGRNEPGFTWEKTHRAEELRKAARL
jgi:S-adenosylmethionine synthetase